MRELAIAYDDIVATYRKLMAPNAAFSPSPLACRFCPAIAICQAVKDRIAPVAALALSRLPDGQGAAALLDNIEVFQVHIDAIRAYYASRLSDDPDYQIPGYAMVPGSVVREITNWQKALGILSDHVGPEALWGAAAYRISELEKALARSQKLKAKDAKTKFNEILNGLISFKENKASLKRVKGEPKVKSLGAPTEAL
jgi:hypothetical protein